VALLAQDLGFEVLVSDAGQLAASAKTELDDAGISYEQGGHSIDEIRHVDVVVKSPGIPWDADFVAFAKTSQVQVVGEMEFCARYAPSRMAQHKRIGITGSNGKTTTTLLTTHLLNTAGLSALEAGNVGTSYARCLLSPSKYEWIVLELSSFQLEDIEQFHCEIGMLLNLSPDHLDRYGGIFETYAQAKYKLLTSAQEGAVWLQPSDPVSLGLKPRVPEGVTVVEMPANFDAGIAKDIVGGERFELTNTPLGGPHNAANASFALTAVKLAGGESGVLAEALKSFVNAPHRLESIGYARGVHYVNDSKATNLDATEKALRSYQNPIILIAGGTDKGNDWNSLNEVLAEVDLRAVVAMGIDNEKILAYFKSRATTVRDTHNLADALITARRLAKSGDVVLLSPACASFDLFHSYIDRGDQFRGAVHALPDFRETL